MDWMQKKRKALKRTLLAASLAAAATSLGCAELEGTLAPAEDCTELGENLRARAIDEMERTLDANLETAVSWIPCRRWSHPSRRRSLRLRLLQRASRNLPPVTGRKRLLARQNHQLLDRQIHRVIHQADAHLQ